MEPILSQFVRLERLSDFIRLLNGERTTFLMGEKRKEGRERFCLREFRGNGGFSCVVEEVEAEMRTL